MLFRRDSLQFCTDSLLVGRDSVLVGRDNVLFGRDSVLFCRHYTHSLGHYLDSTLDHSIDYEAPCCTSAGASPLLQGITYTLCLLPRPVPVTPGISPCLMMFQSVSSCLTMTSTRPVPFRQGYHQVEPILAGTPAFILHQSQYYSQPITSCVRDCFRTYAVFHRVSCR